MVGPSFPPADTGGPGGARAERRPRSAPARLGYAGCSTGGAGPAGPSGAGAIRQHLDEPFMSTATYVYCLVQSPRQPSLKGAPAGPVASTVAFGGTVSSGAVVSVTVTVNALVTMFP